MSIAAPPAGTTVHTLHPGDVRFGWRGDRLVTLLGSCVAVVLTDPRRTVGAMCHIVHAPGPGPATGRRGTAWADVALAALRDGLRARGLEPRLCEAYVYGGGNMFPSLLGPGHVGTANAGWVLQALAADGVRVLHQDLGGHAYRRLDWTVGPGAPVVESVPV